MKISIATFHDTSNFGATLQCAALVSCLRRLGHEPSVVDYLPPYVRAKKSVFREFPKIASAPSPAKAAVRACASLAFVPALKRREVAFAKFISRHLPTGMRYPTAGSVAENPPQADLFICGSDQIWNPALTGKRLDEVFFLRFAKGGKAAFGVSLGEMDIEANGETLRRWTDDFMAVSVREKSVAERLAKVLGRDVSVVLDCTLLLSGRDYADMEIPVSGTDRPYLLLYNVQGSPASVKTALSAAKRLGLGIIDVSPTPSPFSKVPGSRRLIGIGPGEFLALVKNAAFVVTNSFHGTVFSILYEKEFLSIPHSRRGGRTVDLLESVGLGDRTGTAAWGAAASPIDYGPVRARLDALRRDSFAYIGGFCRGDGKPRSFPGANGA